MAVRKEHEHAQIKFLALVLVFPKERVLDMKAKEDLQDWMVDFAPLARTDLNGVRVFHSNGERDSERIYNAGERLEMLFPSV